MLARFRLLPLFCLILPAILAACSGPAAPAGQPGRPTPLPTTITLPAIPVGSEVIGGGGSFTAQATSTMTATRTVTGTVTAGTTATPRPRTATPGTGGGPPATATMPAPAPTPLPPTLTPGPNLGRQLVYVAGGKIMIKEPGGAATALVDNPGAGAGGTPSRLVWSPSGRRLLYTLEPTGVLTEALVLVYDADSGKVHNLGKGTHPAWSADSNNVALNRGPLASDDVVVVSVPDGQEKALGKGQYPTWLPDDQVAVVRDGDVWLLAYSDGAARRLTHLPAGNDGWAITDLAYHYAWGVLIYGGPMRLLGASGNGMNLHAADIRSGAVQQIAEVGGNGLNALDISADGRYIAVADHSHYSACASYGAVTILDTNTGQITRLPLPATDARHAHMFGLSWAPQPTGRLAVSYSEFGCADKGPGEITAPRIFLVDLSNPGDLRPEADGAWPAWNRGRTGLGRAPGAPGGALR